MLLSSAEIFQHAAFQDFHLLLRILQLGLAQFEQFRTALVGRQRLFQRHLPLFHGFDDFFELREGGFKRGSSCGGGSRRGFWSFCHEAGDPQKGQEM